MRIRLMAFAIFSVFVFNGNANASDWIWSAGLSQWYSHWEYESSEKEKTSDDSVFMGPEIKFQKDNIFCEINVLSGLRDINLDDDDQRDFDRKLHWDAAAVFGYQLHPRFDVIAGFKRIDVDYSDLYFGVIGANLNIPVQPISLICSTQYWPFGEVSGLKSIDDANGWSAEVGVAYNAAMHRFYGGYKYQIIHLKDNDSDKDRDSTLSGIVLSYNYKF